MSPASADSSPRSRLTAPRLVGITLAFVGGVVLVAWYLHSLRLVTQPDLWVAMQRSTGAGFLVTGLALLAHCMRRRRTSFLLGGLAAGIGSVALAENLLIGSSSAGTSMAPGTALGLALAGALILAYSSPKTRRPWRDGVTLVLAALICAAGFVGIMAQFLGATSDITAVSPVGMELHTALAFMGLGVAFFMMIGHFRDGLVDQRIPRWASWAAGVGVATLIVGIWAGLKSNEVIARGAAVAQTHNATLTHANTVLREHQRDVERLGVLWGRLNVTQRRELQPDTAVFVTDLPALAQLSWHETGGRAYPLWASAEELSSPQRPSTSVWSAIDRARQSGEVTATEPLLGDHRGQQLVVAVPVSTATSNTGVLVFEHDVEGFFNGIFRDGVARHTALELASHKGFPFYSSASEHVAEGEPDLTAVSPLPPSRLAFADRLWTINGSVDVRGVTGRRATSNTLLLWVGLFLAVAIAFVVRKSELLREKALSLEEAHRDVEKTASELTRANQSLEKQRDSLRRTENQLRRAAREKRRVLDSLSAFLIGVDQDGVVTEWNQVSSDVFGLRSSETLGRSFRDLPLAWDVEALNVEVRESQESGRRVTCTNYSVAGPDDLGDRTVSFTINPTLQEGRGGFAIIGSDVTERQQLEMQLHHAQKLESVGTLAAGIAHEINTPMQFVGDNVRFLSQSVEPITSTLKKVRGMLAEEGEGQDQLRAEVKQAVEDLDVDFIAEEFPSALEETLEGIDRVTTIVRAMKDFSHPGAEGCASADINKALETTLAVARNEYKYHAEIETDYGSLPPVQCWVADLNQVFLNLLVNATHAIRDALGEHSTDMGKIRIETAQVGEEVEVRISDSGSGIPPEVQSKIFDQFFTTKGVGEGTGLGLAICRAVVVDRHGGSLDFRTEAGEGTTFIVRLPIVQQTEELEADEAHSVR